MRKIRENIRNNPKAYEEAKRKEQKRYHERVEAGKIKITDELNELVKEILEKYGKTRKNRFAKKVREEAEKPLIEDTPPGSSVMIVDAANIPSC